MLGARHNIFVLSLSVILFCKESPRGNIFILSLTVVLFCNYLFLIL